MLPFNPYKSHFQLGLTNGKNPIWVQGASAESNPGRCAIWCRIT